MPGPGLEPERDFCHKILGRRIFFYLVRRSPSMRGASGAVIERNARGRALVDALERSGLELAHIESEATRANLLNERLREIKKARALLWTISDSLHSVF